ncbi:Molybdate-anion transporter, partial [Camellia lanceoleosa]
MVLGRKLGTVYSSFGSSMLFGTIRACVTYCITYIPKFAILSQVIWESLVDSLSLGPVAPFDADACFLAIGMSIILSSPDEKIALLGAIQSLFEGSMYTFVFLWTPALSPNNEEIPHGFIFATFMLASMLGSSVASRLMACSSLKVESYMQIVFLISAVSLFIPVGTNVLVSPSTAKGGSISFSGYVLLVGFCAFEACVGIFWPSIMKMRSQYIPEEVRSTIMNFLRIPLNIFVCVVLYNLPVKYVSVFSTHPTHMYNIHLIFVFFFIFFLFFLYCLIFTFKLRVILFKLTSHTHTQKK